VVTVSWLLALVFERGRTVITILAHASFVWTSCPVCASGPAVNEHRCQIVTHSGPTLVPRRIATTYGWAVTTKRKISHRWGLP